MRLIDADERIRFIDMGHLRSPYEKSFSDSEVVDLLETAPTIDAVEVVRCKDCKNWDTTWQNDYAPNYHYCPMIDGTRRNDFYCADAERRTDETDRRRCTIRKNEKD